MKPTHIIIAIVAILSTTAYSQPSGGFYVMKNKLNGEILCTQNPISVDWERQSGPYLDQECTLPEPKEEKNPNLPSNPLDLNTTK